MWRGGPERDVIHLMEANKALLASLVRASSVVAEDELVPKEKIFAALIRFLFRHSIRDSTVRPFFDRIVSSVDWECVSTSLIVGSGDFPRHPARLGPAEIKTLRLCLDLSQRDLAELLGVKHESVSNWESGHRALSAGHQRALIAECLNRVRSQ